MSGPRGFAVELDPPKLHEWAHGNSGVPGIWSFTAPAPGPHVALLALTHGNEFAGALVVAELLEAGLRPQAGTLSLGFANLAAFARFDRAAPTISRFIDEDLNRLWDTDQLDGSRRSVELDRARELRPWVDTVDRLMDLHSMLWPSDPLLLCGHGARGRALGQAVGIPRLIVADAGHRSGRRLIDYRRFIAPEGEAAAVLVEGGQHWQPATQALLRDAARRFLHVAGTVTDGPVCGMTALAEVTDAITAETADFVFIQDFRGGEIVRRRGTLIALDGTTEIRTPYDDCLLVMPSLKPTRGHTAVRLARVVG